MGKKLKQKKGSGILGTPYTLRIGAAEGRK
jgi:hypothetical protein